MTTYVSEPLDDLEKENFLKLFYTIDQFRSSEITIKPVKVSSKYYDAFVITFTPQDEEGAELIRRSFESLTLYKKGWRNKFKLVQP